MDTFVVLFVDTFVDTERESTGSQHGGSGLGVAQPLENLLVQGLV